MLLSIELTRATLLNIYSLSRRSESADHLTVKLFPMTSPCQTVSDDRSTEQSAGHKSDHLPAKLLPMIDHLTDK